MPFTIPTNESETVEFKQSFQAEVIETLVAFANAKGGSVYIGLQDDGSIKGVDITQETVVQWINEVKTKTSPTLIPDGEVIEVNGKTIVVLKLQEYPIKPVSFRGKYYKRVKNSNHLLSTTEVVNMHLQTFNTSWDYHLSHQFGLEDLSLDKVQQVIDTINFELKLNITDDPLTFLLKHDLVRDGAITNAAYLLFTKKEILFTTVELGRFQTSIIIKDTARSKCDILNQVDEVLNFVKKHINKEVIITERIRNTQRWQYPLDALREIVLNMIIHRDYRSSSDSIVKVFDHKIEFYNPGRLPDTITVEDLLNNTYKSTPRNKLIADFCKAVGIIEKYGSGIQRIINYFEKANLPRPVFENISDGFQVVVFDGYDEKGAEKGYVVENVPENVPENVLENRENLIVELMKQKETISMEEMADKLNVNIKTIKRDLQKLKQKSLLRRIGPDKGGHWEINK